MDGTHKYAHRWHSQVGQSRSTLEKRATRSTISSLASYLPTEPKRSTAREEEEKRGYAHPEVSSIARTVATQGCNDSTRLGQDGGMGSKYLSTARPASPPRSILPRRDLNSSIREPISRISEDKHGRQNGAEKRYEMPSNFTLGSHEMYNRAAEPSFEEDFKKTSFFYPDMLQTFRATEPRSPTQTWHCCSHENLPSSQYGQSTLGPHAEKSYNEYLDLRKTLDNVKIVYPDMLKLQRDINPKFSTRSPPPPPPLPPRICPTHSTSPTYLVTTSEKLPRQPVSTQRSYIASVPELPAESWTPQYGDMRSSSPIVYGASRPTSMLNAELIAPEDTIPDVSRTSKEPKDLCHPWSDDQGPPQRRRKEVEVKVVLFNDALETEKTESCPDMKKSYASVLQGHVYHDAVEHSTTPCKEGEESLLCGEADSIKEPAQSHRHHQSQSCSEGRSEKHPAYDSFYTPENEKFYAAKPYTNLNHGLNEIRLLRIFPRQCLSKHYENHINWDPNHSGYLDKNERLIACEIEKTSLTRISGNYATISYCAGDPNKTAVIIANGIPFNAFANLEHAIDRLLAHWMTLHADDEPLLLWADQICINQSDKNERSQQVQIMRNIYKRSAETYVCLSVPRSEDCLYWVTQIMSRLVQPVKLSSFWATEPDAVDNFKSFLWSILVDSSGSIQPRSPPIHPPGSIQRADNDHEYYVESFDLPRVSQVSTELPLVLEHIKGAHNESSTRLRSGIRSLTRKGTINEDLSIAALSSKFQSSLGSFMTNKWWRRSWVYQEFLSASYIYFISGTVSVPWSHLSILVDFVCNHLDQHMEEIRKRFESQITQEMRQKDRENQERENILLEKQRERLRRMEQRKMKEDEEKRRKVQAERRQRQQQEEYRRQIKAQQELQTCRNRALKEEQRAFEEERYLQWKAALDAQNQRRTAFDKQQQSRLRQDIHRVNFEKRTLKRPWLNVRRTIQINKELKALKQFEIEVMKPIGEQIKRAARFESWSRSKVDEELDKSSGMRICHKRRLEELRELDKVPMDLNKFSTPGLRPPLTLVASPVIPHENRAVHQSFAAPLQDQPSLPVDQSDGHVKNSEDDATSIHITSFINQLPEFENDSVQESDDGSDQEQLNDQQTTSLQILGVREIELRDKITRLQDNFRQLDRSALASMLKGKQSFRNRSDLIALLQHSRNCAASDARDRIYAFVGLADPTYNIIPDYSTDNHLEQVLTETAKSIIRYDQSLDILRHVHRGRDKLGPKLPSWVPDWTSREKVCAIDRFDSEDMAPFSASKDTQAITEFKIMNSGESTCECLKVKAVFVGRVEHVEGEIGFDGLSLISLATEQKALGPTSTRHDDQVWVLYGAKRPVVLMPAENNTFSYLGDVVMFDDTLQESSTLFPPIMYGQMIDKVQEGTAATRDIWLV